MRTRFAYFATTIFAIVGFTVFSAVAVRAIFLGRLGASVGLGVFSVCLGWLAWTLFAALRQFQEKYVISSDCISCVSEKVLNPIALSEVKSVIVDAREGYVYLRGSSEEELLRVQIDNPIVPELKARFTVNETG